MCFVLVFFKEIDQLASQSGTMAGYRKNTADLFVFLGGAQEESAETAMRQAMMPPQSYAFQTMKACP